VDPGALARCLRLTLRTYGWGFFPKHPAGGAAGSTLMLLPSKGFPARHFSNFALPTTSVGFCRSARFPTLPRRPNDSMSGAIPNRTLFLPSVLLAAGWAMLCRFAPWQQVHPSNTALIATLGRAPLWSHIYDGIPGARVDAIEFILETSALLFICVLLMSFHSSVRARHPR
jgi:hypothetical protein